MLELLHSVSWRLLTATVLAAGMAGCDATKPAAKRAIVRFDDVGVTGSAADVNTFARAETQTSIGRFPAGIGVARVCLEAEGPAGTPALVLDPLSSAEAPYWNELFDSIDRIRELVLIDPQGVPQRYVTIPQLLASCRKQKGRLCLVYAQNDIADNASQVIGALYDADSGELVGTAFAEEVVDPKEKRERPADRPDGDERHMDAHWLAEQKFRQIVRDFVWELINRDREPGAPEEPATTPAIPAPAPVTSAPGGA